MTQHEYPSTLPSIPALAAALRCSQRPLPAAVSARRMLRQDPVVRMYAIAGDGVDEEAQAAVHVLLSVAERLRRLGEAYGEWKEFDAGAYFDLTENQTAQFVRVVERVTTVHVVFFADLLMPSFQQAQTYWLEEFQPHYLDVCAHLQHGDAPQETVLTFTEQSQPRMVEQWTRLLQVTHASRMLLGEEIGFWAANGGGEERARWRWAWQQAPASGIAPELLPALSQVPTLTLAVDFPLPAYRQPGRLRRLRRLQARRQWGTLRLRSN